MCKGKPVRILYHVNMTSKRAFLQKVTALLTSTTEKEDFTLKKLFWVFFSVTTIAMDNS